MMAGSIADNAALYKKTYTYIAPTPPAILIESTSYTLDFVARKFIHVGIDPTCMFNVAIHIITSSRYINISPDFLRRIFSLMGNILSFILDTPQKYKRTLFLETDMYKLSSMVFNGENTLVLESKTHVGCRVLLNRADLMQLQYLEACINEKVKRKSTIIKSVVLSQFYKFVDYIAVEFTKRKSPPKTNEEMEIYIKTLCKDHIIANTVNEDFNFISQLKMYAATQLTEQLAHRWNGDIASKVIQKIYYY